MCCPPKTVDPSQAWMAVVYKRPTPASDTTLLRPTCSQRGFWVKCSQVKTLSCSLSPSPASSLASVPLWGTSWRREMLMPWGRHRGISTSTWWTKKRSGRRRWATQSGSSPTWTVPTLAKLDPGDLIFTTWAHSKHDWQVWKTLTVQLSPDGGGSDGQAAKSQISRTLQSG